MIRERLPKHGQAIADMSQFSVQAGRQDAEKRYYNLVTERDVLKKDIVELELQLSLLKSDTRSLLTLNKERQRLTQELIETHSRLHEIKPTMTKLHAELFEHDGQILRAILATLKDIQQLLEARP